MDIYRETYTGSLKQNEDQSMIWMNQLKALKDLNLNIFLKNMKVPALVPIGSRLMFPGEIVHINEIIVSLGAGYFAKCSVKQAEIIRQHRIKRTEEKLEALKKEKQYLENNLSFSKKNVLDETRKEVVEEYNEEAEKNWRKKHREHVKTLKDEERKSKESLNESDNKLWERLEELELKEELEREYYVPSKECDLTFGLQLHSAPGKLLNDRYKSQNQQDDPPNLKRKIIYSTHENHCITDDRRADFDLNVITSKDNRHNRVLELKKRLFEVNNRDKVPCSSEEEVLKRLDQLEYQEILEDELDVLEDESDNEEVASSSEVSNAKPKKSITFASDFDDDCCIEINFKHSGNSPSSHNYVKNAGILKPCDIYSTFPENFKKTSTVPILKRTEYNVQPSWETHKDDEKSIVMPSEPIHVNIVGEVRESIEHEKKLVTSERPVSKFRAMRMKKK